MPPLSTPRKFQSFCGGSMDIFWYIPENIKKSLQIVLSAASVFYLLRCPELSAPPGIIECANV